MADRVPFLYSNGRGLMEALLDTEVETNTFTPPARALIADDQPDIVEALRLLLKGEGYQIEGTNSPQGILDLLSAGRFDLVLMDLNYARDTTSGREGLDLVERIQALDPLLPIVVMTAWSSVPLAVEAMRRGVRDFVEKPWDNRQILATLHKQVERARADRARERHEQWETEEIRVIERGLLPHRIPQIPGYAIAATSQPVSTVGGDYFDTIELSGQTLALCVADVSGKGMPAALVMSNLQASVRTSAIQDAEPSVLAARLNQLMCANLPAGRFVTFFYALLDAPSGKMRYVNGGHNAPILSRQDGSVVRLSEGGPALGMFASPRYEQGEVTLAPGDRLLLFTDGITEAADPHGQEFGEERLVNLLVGERGSGAEALKQRILGEIAGFCDGRFQDDATLVALAVMPSFRFSGE